MLWRQGVQKLSNHKLKSPLTFSVWSQCTPDPGRETDGRTSWQ